MFLGVPGIVRPMELDDYRQDVAIKVEAKRRMLGWSKERAAREAEISSITWKRIEDGLPVQDVKMDAALRVLGINVSDPAEERPVTPPEHDAEEILFRLPPNLTARQREAARRLAEASVRAYLESLDDD